MLFSWPATPTCCTAGKEKRTTFYLVYEGEARLCQPRSWP